MHYTDLDRRIRELHKIASILEIHGLFETASRIIGFEALLSENISAKTQFREFINLVELCECEFGNQDVGGDYRRECFNQIGHLILDASAINGMDVRATLNNEFRPMFQQINSGRKIVGELSEFARNKNVGGTILFHLSCYSYVIIVEATFDELARILFFLYSLKGGKRLTLKELQDLEVSYIYNKLEPKPAFLHNWKEKKHTRNAISHATAYYNDLNKSVRFIDNVVEPFDKTMSVLEFGEQLLELESSLDAFIFFNLLLKVNDLLFCLNLFEQQERQ